MKNNAINGLESFSTPLTHSLFSHLAKVLSAKPKIGKNPTDHFFFVFLNRLITMKCDVNYLWNISTQNFVKTYMNKKPIRLLK